MIIETPLFNIEATTHNGRLLIKQNTLTQAMGLNKFLSPTCSRLGQFINNSNALIWIKNVRWLDAQIVVEKILPQYLNGFLYEIRGSPSRQQFCKNDPVFISKSTMTVLAILKETIMAYDENSPQTKKGNIGEEIYCDYMKGLGYFVDHMKNYRVYDVDFFCSKGNQRIYSEVKAFDSFILDGQPVFKIKEKIVDRAYGYAENQGIDSELIFTDGVSGRMYMDFINALLAPYELKLPNGTTSIYPKKIKIDNEDGSFDMGYAFHFHQFKSCVRLSTEQIDKLRSINISNREYPTIESFDKMYPILPEQGELTDDCLKPNPESKTTNAPSTEWHGKIDKTIAANKVAIRTARRDNGELWCFMCDFLTALRLKSSINLNSSPLGRFVKGNKLIKPLSINDSKNFKYFISLDSLVNQVMPAILDGRIVLKKAPCRKAAEFVYEDLKKVWLAECQLSLFDKKDAAPLPEPKPEPKAESTPKIEPPPEVEPKQSLLSKIADAFAERIQLDIRLKDLFSQLAVTA